eukprot:PITA_18327
MLIPGSLCCDSCLYRSKLVYHSQPPLPEIINDASCQYGPYATNLMNSGKQSVATASTKIYRDGKGCGACYQIRCTDPALCTKSGVKVVVTGMSIDDRTDFYVYSPTFLSLARPNKSEQLLNGGAGLDVEYKRVPCEYPGQNMAIKVDESSAYPNFLAVKFLYEGGQTDISAVEVARVGQWRWYSMSPRKYSAVWEIANSDLFDGQGQPPSLSFRLLVTGGSEGSWVWQAGRNLLPANWKVGSVYDSGLQITERALEFNCTSCATGDWKDQN